jgi:hypothetical protein
MANKRFTVFDSDSHVVEPPELWTKYLESEYRTLGKHALWREEGKLGAYLKINGKVFRDTSNSNIPRHAIWRSGMTWDKVGELDPTQRHPMTAGASDPHARLRDMDAMGIDQAFLYPTWFAEGFHLVEDPDVAYALARAYNDWIADFCKAAPERLFAAAMVPLQNMDYTVEELRRVAKIPCFRGAFIRPMFLEGTTLLIPSTIPYGRSLRSSGLRRRYIRRPDCGIPNGLRMDRFSRRSSAVSTSDRLSRTRAAGRMPEAAEIKASLSLHHRPLVIRYHRSCRTGWTTICSSRLP